MNTEYLNLYNSFVKLTTDKNLYKNVIKQDTFADRLVLFLFHFAVFLTVYKNKENSNDLQKIYDFNFRQLELSIREIGYGDQSINKKMKDYINLFHSIVSEIHFWDDYSNIEKENKFSKFFDNFSKIDYLIEYFDDYRDNLKKKTLNSYIKSVSND
jgi:cytochrome b pre-mRNA-processing protein 3